MSGPLSARACCIMQTGGLTASAGSIASSSWAVGQTIVLRECHLPNLIACCEAAVSARAALAPSAQYPASMLLSACPFWYTKAVSEATVSYKGLDQPMAWTHRRAQPVVSLKVFPQQPASRLDTLVTPQLVVQCMGVSLSCTTCCTAELGTAVLRRGCTLCPAGHVPDASACPEPRYSR